jgi:hypothetical protein
MGTIDFGVACFYELKLDESTSSIDSETDRIIQTM